MRFLMLMSIMLILSACSTNPATTGSSALSASAVPVEAAQPAITPIAASTLISATFEPVPEPEPSYLGLRNQILNLEPTEVGLAQSQDIPNVWGVLTEIGFPQGAATVVSLADGTTSLYTSTGGGMIGGGEYPDVAQASKALVAIVEQHFESMSSTTTFPLPTVGRVRFYILTFSGVFTDDVEETELSQGTHTYSSLYQYAQEVITQMRLHNEQSK